MHCSRLCLKQVYNNCLLSIQYAVLQSNASQRRAVLATRRFLTTMFFAMIHFKPIAGANASSEWGLQQDAKSKTNMLVTATLALRLSLVQSRFVARSNIDLDTVVHCLPFEEYIVRLSSSLWQRALLDSILNYCRLVSTQISLQNSSAIRFPSRKIGLASRCFVKQARESTNYLSYSEL